MNLEVERYELRETFGLRRREFLGLVVVLVVGADEAGAQRRAGGGETPKEIGAWLHIGEDGAVTVYTGKAEVGQNIRTSLAQAVAEELRLPLERVRLVMADTAQTPYDSGTSGSRTTPGMAPQLRRAAAAAREALVRQAAAQWSVDGASLGVRDGRVVHGATSRSVGFGELTRGKKLIETIAAEAAPAAPAGTAAAKVNGRAFVTGRHLFASDLRLPGMLYGRVLRPPSFGAKLVSVDGTVVRDGDLVGVVAEDSYAAAKALEEVKAEWKAEPQPSDSELFDLLAKDSSRRRAVHSAGSVDGALGSAEVRLSQTYRTAYIAHAPLEPRAAVAQWEGDKLTVWTGTQIPFGVRNQLAQTFGMKAEQVRVIVPDTGSAYGGKHTGECAVEAARLARAAARPVRLVWTREEEFTWAYFRPAGVMAITAGMTKDGIVTAWKFRNYNSGTSGIRTPYDSAHQEIEFCEAAYPLRQGSYRALGSTGNNFAREVMMDELAEAAGADPLEFRLKNLKEPRLRTVLESAAEAFGWKKGGRAGVACGTEKGGFVASCAEASVERGEVRVRRVVTAFECGAIVNPDHLRSQIEGGVMMALGGALFERIRFANGKILNPRFSEYRVPRFSDAPALKTVLVDRKDLPSAGAGETPMIALAPAVAGAVYQLTGKRLRSLPLAPEGLG